MEGNLWTSEPPVHSGLIKGFYSHSTQSDIPNWRKLRQVQAEVSPGNGRGKTEQEKLICKKRNFFFHVWGLFDYYSNFHLLLSLEKIQKETLKFSLSFKV